MVKSPICSYKGLEFNSSNLHGIPQPSLTPTSGSDTFSWPPRTLPRSLRREEEGGRGKVASQVLAGEEVREAVCVQVCG